MASHFANLCHELVERIAAQLTSKADLLSLRLASRGIYAKTLWQFGRTCLSTIQTDLSPKDLERLQAISKLRQLAPCIQTLVITPNPDRSWGGGQPWSRGTTGLIEAPLPNGFIKLQELIVETWKNCRSFVISAGGGPGTDFTLHDSNRDLISADIIELMLSTIIQNRLAVRSFEIDFKEGGTHELDTRALRLSQYEQPIFRSAWASITELSIDMDMTPDTFDWVKNLVLQAPNLHSLSLHLGFELFDKLLSQMLESQNLPKLRALTLRAVHLPYELLMKTLTRFSETLQLLCLQFITIVAGGTWQELFVEMDRSFPVLGTLALGRIRQRPGPKPLQFDTLLSDQEQSADSSQPKFEFSENGWSRMTSGTRGVKFAGSRSEMSKALGRLSKMPSPPIID